MTSLPPYAELLGLVVEGAEGDAPVIAMPFAQGMTGRPGFLHGGAIAGLLEIAAFAALKAALGDDQPGIKPVNVTVNFLRGGIDHRTFARGSIIRLGRRVASLEAVAWQRDRSRPIATAMMNCLLSRG